MSKTQPLTIASLFCIIFLINVTSARGGIVVVNGLTKENTVQTGSSYRGSVSLQNPGSKVQSVRIYLKDYLYNYKGESRHDPPNSHKRSNAGWISYNPEMITLKPGETSAVNFEVNVPAGDSLRGTYWSVLMIEEIAPPDTSSNEGSITITTSVRYAVQIITNIGNTGISDMKFSDFKLEGINGSNNLHVAVENTGERILKPQMNLELFDESGSSAAVIKSDPRKMYPGTSIMTTLDLDGVNPGNYQGVLVVDCGEDRLFGTNLSLEIK
jgi:hypothetical protein